MFKKILLASLVLAIAGSGAFVLYRVIQFRSSYELYKVLAEAHVKAAFLPGSADNPVRQELNRVLSEVLGKEMSAPERRARALDGLRLLEETEKQIDAMGETGDSVLYSINTLESYALGSSRRELVALAQERSRIIGDIRGLSYRASYHTAEIFNRVIHEEGELTEAHVRSLNEQVPLVEEQFDRRTSLYADLEAINLKITRVASELSL